MKDMPLDDWPESRNCLTCARSMGVTNIMCKLPCESRSNNAFWIHRLDRNEQHKTICKDCVEERNSACECLGTNGVPDCCSIYNERHQQEVVVPPSRFYTTERNDELKEIRPTIVWEE